MQKKILIILNLYAANNLITVGLPLDDFSTRAIEEEVLAQQAHPPERA